MSPTRWCRSWPVESSVTWAGHRANLYSFHTDEHDDPLPVCHARLAGRLQETDATLITSVADILGVAVQELIEAELTARIGAERW